MQFLPRGIKKMEEEGRKGEKKTRKGGARRYPMKGSTETESTEEKVARRRGEKKIRKIRRNREKGQKQQELII